MKQISSKSIVFILLLFLGLLIGGISYSLTSYFKIQPITKPFIELLPAENTISSKNKVLKNATQIDCQPESFDPKTTPYKQLPLTTTTGYWEREIFRIDPIKNRDAPFDFSVKTENVQGYEIKEYTFGCASSFDFVLDIQKDGKRVALYTHIVSFYFSDKSEHMFMDNYVKSSSQEYVNKKRILTLDGKNEVAIPNRDCVSRFAQWSNGKLITYSDQNKDTSALQGDAYQNYKTTFCIWDANGKLNEVLQSKVSWYGANSNSLWAEIGILPTNQKVFYIYDYNGKATPPTCAVYLQGLKNQLNNKVVNLFPESGEMQRNLCPISPYLELDLSKTTMNTPTIRFRILENNYDPNSYQKYREWQTVSN